MSKRVVRLALVILSVAVFAFSSVPVASAAGVVQIVAEPGVSEAIWGNGQVAIDLTVELFRNTFGMELERDIKLVIAPNQDAYIQALQREFRVTQEEAERRARTTSGWSAGRTIVQNAASLPTRRQQVFNTAHELVHQYQGQTCGGRCGAIKWLHEGTGDAIAAQVVELAGEQTLEQYKTAWTSELRRAQKRPSLSALYTTDEWYVALDQYGSSLTYRTAGVATLGLVEQAGTEALWAYFAALQEADAPDAFIAAFGLSLEEQEALFPP